ncbi:unnamed protein product [Rhizophagus irregularis]|nr:unnamed protein product [Rhizophagus irregularis]
MCLLGKPLPTDYGPVFCKKCNGDLVETVETRTRYAQGLLLAIYLWITTVAESYVILCQSQIPFYLCTCIIYVHGRSIGLINLGQNKKLLVDQIDDVSDAIKINTWKYKPVHTSSFLNVITTTKSNGPIITADKDDST